MKRLLLALLAALAAPAAAQRTNSPGEVSGPVQGRVWEEDQRRDRPESEAALPAWPKNENLIEFQVANTSSFRFYIDAASLSLSPERIVRYTLIARSASGVANVSYEGMRCPENQYRIYAYGQDGRWVRQRSDWRAIEPKPTQRWHQELSTNYFCLARGTILSVEEGLDALRRGGHPGRKSGLGN
ncbi:MAG: CNP1-like family protein [Burkholderiales bacterium]